MSMSASLGLARWHMQTMQTSEFLPLLGHSSGSAVSWDVFRGGWHRTAISGILLWLGVVCLFCLPACFQVPARSALLIYSICYRTFSNFFRNFEIFVRRLPDVSYIATQYYRHFPTTTSFRQQMRKLIETFTANNT